MMRDVATDVPTTHGMPYSRLTMAAWVSEPPPSHTQPAMRAKAGVQLGEVASHDQDLALLEVRNSSVADTITLARPCTVPAEAGKPVSTVASASAFRPSK